MLSDTTLAAVFELLLRAPTLRRLDLSAAHQHGRAGITRREIGALLRCIIDARHTLRSLRLGRCEAFDADEPTLGLLLRASGGELHNKLASLSLQATALDIAWLVPLLASAAPLRRLALRDLIAPAELPMVLAALSLVEPRKPTPLALRFDRANCVGAEPLPPPFASRLSSLRLLGASGLAHALAAWRTAPLVNLRLLDASLSDFNDSALAAVAIVCPSLQVSVCACVVFLSVTNNDQLQCRFSRH
jgi:hypothetical protein